MEPSRLRDNVKRGAGLMRSIHEPERVEYVDKNDPLKIKTQSCKKEYVHGKNTCPHPEV
jgi:hypothetical protein